ncbi:hypothetical protein GCM10009789_67030 [Kribbella sancticallisti]|uniref:Uncharacterized protein n=1 Tax=Kribbella sancticallisti TaxID=460087 RepID=A0ABP4Q8R2_9ACTN
MGIGRPAVIAASTPRFTRFEAPQAGYAALPLTCQGPLNWHDTVEQPTETPGRVPPTRWMAMHKERETVAHKYSD